MSPTGHRNIVCKPVSLDPEPSTSNSHVKGICQGASFHSGDAPSTHIWKKHGNKVTTDANYTIDSLSESHSGCYTVESLD